MFGYVKIQNVNFNRKKSIVHEFKYSSIDDEETKNILIVVN